MCKRFFEKRFLYFCRLKQTERMSAREYLQQHKIQYTIEREEVVTYLMENLTHPTADEVYRGLKLMDSSVSRATVFNTLKTLAEHHAVSTLLIEEGVIRYDISTKPHAHFRCSRCGRIADVVVNSNASFCLPEGYSACNISYVIVGRCPECQEK